MPFIPNPMRGRDIIGDGTSDDTPRRPMSPPSAWDMARMEVEAARANLVSAQKVVDMTERDASTYDAKPHAPGHHLQGYYPARLAVVRGYLAAAQKRADAAELEWVRVRVQA